MPAVTRESRCDAHRYLDGRAWPVNGIERVPQRGLPLLADGARRIQLANGAECPAALAPYLVREEVLDLAGAVS